MNRQRVAIALAAAALLVAFAWWLEVERPARQAAELEARSRLAGDADLVSLIVAHEANPALGLPAESYSLTKRADGAWTLSSTATPRALLADTRAVLPLVEALQRGRVRQELAPSADALPDRHQYGLDPPAVTVEWKDAAGGGGKVAVGGPSPGTKSGYARVTDGRLVLVPLDLLHAADWDLAHFREKSVLRLDGAQPDCLDILRIRDVPPGSSQQLFFSLDNVPGGNPDLWLMTPPGTAIASRVRITSLLSKLASLQAQGFGAEEPTDAELRAAGLVPPTAVLRLRTERGTEHVLELGDEAAEPDSAWARADGGPLVLVRVDLRWDALAPDIAWRETHPFTMDVQAVTEVTWRKGVRDPLVLTLARGEDGAWRRLAPTEAPATGQEPGAFLSALAEPQCGRFEDDVAADPILALALYDFRGRGAASFSVRGRADDGSTLALDAEVSAPFIRENDVFAAVRTHDGADRDALCIVKASAYDMAAGLAQALAERQSAPASRP